MRRTTIRRFIVVALAGAAMSAAACVPDPVPPTESALCLDASYSTRDAVEAFHVANGLYPTSQTDLVPAYLSATAGNRVAITFGPSGTLQPTYSWVGACAGQEDLPPVPPQRP